MYIYIYIYVLVSVVKSLPKGTPRIPSGFEVSLRFRVWGLGFRVWGFRVSTRTPRCRAFLRSSCGFKRFGLQFLIVRAPLFQRSEHHEPAPFRSQISAQALKGFEREARLIGKEIGDDAVGTAYSQGATRLLCKLETLPLPGAAGTFDTVSRTSPLESKPCFSLRNIHLLV